MSFTQPKALLKERKAEMVSFTGGSSLVPRRKSSGREFWSQVRRHGITFRGREEERSFSPSAAGVAS